MILLQLCKDFWKERYTEGLEMYMISRLLLLDLVESLTLIKEALSGIIFLIFFFSSRRRHTRFDCDWSSDVCSSDLWARRAARDPDGGRCDDRAHRGARRRRLRRRDRARARERRGRRRRPLLEGRSEERRVGKECRSRWSPYH